MTDIEKKALALVNEVKAEWKMPLATLAYINRDAVQIDALCRAIEQHEATKADFEAFRREVSDALEYFMDGPVGLGTARERLGRFIIPKPVDPLVEVLREVTNDGNPATMAAWQKEADTVREAMKERGYEWTKIE